MLCQDFRQTLDETTSGLVYADPPYVPLSRTASFTSYAPAGFGISDQEALAACLRRCDQRGVQFVLSNSMTPEVVGLYSGFCLLGVPARRAINSNGGLRGPVQEAIVTNYVPPAAL